MNSVHTLLFIVCALHYPVFHLSVKYAEHESLQNAIASHTKSLLAARYVTQYVTHTEFGNSKDRYHKIIQDDDDYNCGGDDDFCGDDDDDQGIRAFAAIQLNVHLKMTMTKTEKKTKCVKDIPSLSPIYLIVDIGIFISMVMLMIII